MGRFELIPVRCIGVDSARRLRIITTREDRPAGLLVLKAALVETLTCHVEVLHLELFDTLAQDSIHLTHVDELIVDFVHAACAILVTLSGLTRGIRLLRLLSTRVVLCILVFQEATMLCIAHSDLRLHLLRKHAFQVM